MADVFSCTDEDEEEFEWFANWSFTCTSTAVDINNPPPCEQLTGLKTTLEDSASAFDFLHLFFDDEVPIHLVTETKDFQF